MRRVLFVFVDGVGIGPDDALVNPAAVCDWRWLRAAAGAVPVAGSVPARTGASASIVGLDAALGRPGLPQSGTGQATLLTGVNAAERFGRHFGPWTPTALRPLVESRSVLAAARLAGRRVAFANAYPEELVQLIGRAGRLPLPLRSGPVIAAHGAGALTRHTAELAEGDAVASEIVNDGWRERLQRTRVPRIEPERAGANLARIANTHDLTLYAHYSTDTIGHEQDLAASMVALERVDRFLGAVAGGLETDVLLLVASDHGNIEDTRAQHTTNPALCIVSGDGHAEVAGKLTSILDVMPLILEEMQLDRTTAAGGAAKRRPGSA